MRVWIFNERPFKILIFIVGPSWDMRLHFSSLWFLSQTLLSTVLNAEVLGAPLKEWPGIS